MGGDRIDWIFDGEQAVSLEERYDIWAATYDTDHDTWRWRGPDLVAAATLRHIGAHNSTATIDPKYSETMVGGGSYVVAVTDRPEVRAVMEFIASPDYGHANVETGIGFIPANTRFDLDAIPNATERRIAELTRAAVASDGFRFDASDLMPVEVGTGTFWAGMVDWFVNGPEALDEIMAAIEADWPTDEPAD